MRRGSYALVIVLAVPSALLLLAGCVSVSAQPPAQSRHSTPEPAAILYLRQGAEPLELDPSGPQYELAWSILDSFARTDATEPNLWPEDPNEVTEPVPVSELVTDSRRLVPETQGASRLVYVFEPDTWLAFPGDHTASQPLADGAARQQGVPFRSESGGGTEYHVRQVTIDWAAPPAGVSAMLRTEASQRVDGVLPTGAWLRVVGEGIRPAVLAFTEALR